MRDPTIPDADNRKKIMFYDSADRQARLRVRCDFDGISQSQFFRMMVTGYIENDELLHAFLDKCKDEYKIQGQQKRSKIKKFHSKGEETVKQFSLEGDEIEDIFDILEMETGL